MAYQAKNDGFKGMVVPRENANEASLEKGIVVYAVRHLKELAEGYILRMSLSGYTI